MKRGWMVGFLIAALAAVPAGAQPAPPAGQGPAATGFGTSQAAGTAGSEGLVRELNRLREGLKAKESELAKLRHKWLISKGRNPTKEEVEAFEKKRQKGEAKLEDNPYINKSPLNSVARCRAAYFEKLEETNRDKETIKKLEQQLGQ